jgi:hypothetical protein
VVHPKLNSGVLREAEGSVEQQNNLMFTQAKEFL